MTTSSGVTFSVRSAPEKNRWTAAASRRTAVRWLAVSAAVLIARSGAATLSRNHARQTRDHAEQNRRDALSDEQVIDMHRQEFGDEYRIKSDGPHPVESLRAAERSRRA